jgi:hypothetical protein
MAFSSLSNSRTVRVIASVAVGAAAIAGALFSPVAANAAGGTYYPSGPQKDVPLSTVTSGGWVLCWSNLYGQSETDFRNVFSGTAAGSVSACDGDQLLATGWANSDPTTLIALAAATKSDVMTETGHNSPHLANGSYWYYTPNESFGFSGFSNIQQSSCDVQDGWSANDSADSRLCWHLGDWGGGTAYTLQGGWRVGAVSMLNDSGDYTRAIFKQVSQLHKGSVTNASTIARSFKLATPVGGSLVLSVSDASSGSCRIVNNKVFAFAAGGCAVTVTSLKANGDTRATRTRNYMVG